MATKFVKKRCALCGHQALVPQRQQRCHQRRFGRGSYACWGQLVRVVRQRPTRPLREAIQAMAEDPDSCPHCAVRGCQGGCLPESARRNREGTVHKQEARPQDVAARKLDQTRKAIGRAQIRLNIHARKMAQQAKAIRRLERSAAHYAKRASMTDAEVEQERAYRKTPKKVRRGMQL